MFKNKTKKEILKWLQKNPMKTVIYQFTKGDLIPSDDNDVYITRYNQDIAWFESKRIKGKRGETDWYKNQLEMFDFRINSLGMEIYVISIEKRIKEKLEEIGKTESKLSDWEEEKQLLQSDLELKLEELEILKSEQENEEEEKNV